jgi:hypothetical protein
MLTIQTRQNSKGNWWCNTTWNGYDISVEGQTIDDAQSLMIVELGKQKCSEIRNWSLPKFYDKKVNKLKSSKDYITYAKSRIDNNPIA